VDLDDTAVDRGRDRSQVRQRYFGRRDSGEPGECRAYFNDDNDNAMRSRLPRRASKRCV
jgi:hypothetical protein